MEIEIKGEMELDDISKALVEKLKEVKCNLAIHHSKGASLFIYPVNEYGEKIFPRNTAGREIKKFTVAAHIEALQMIINFNIGEESML